MTGFRVNPHRQLNEAETRIYAAGMAAARRGETRPVERLPADLYAIWRMGWCRIGRPVFSGAVFRSHDHTTQAHGIHMIRTEVETLDQALDVIDIQQRSKKAAATKKADASPTAWRTELRLSANRAKQRAKKNSELATDVEAMSELEQRILDRVGQVIRMLHFSVEEMSILAAVRPYYPAVNPEALIGIIEKLCHMTKQDMPAFTVQRRRQTQTQRCLNCGAALRSTDVKYCLYCEPVGDDDSIRAASEVQRQRRRNIKILEGEVRSIQTLIDKTEEAIRNGDNQGHGGHQGKDSASLETGGREENLDRRSAPPHRLGANDPGNVES